MSQSVRLDSYIWWFDLLNPQVFCFHPPRTYGLTWRISTCLCFIKPYNKRSANFPITPQPIPSDVLKSHLHKYLPYEPMAFKSYWRRISNRKKNQTTFQEYIRQLAAFIGVFVEQRQRGLELEDSGFESREGKEISLVQNVQKELWDPSTFLLKGYWGSFQFMCSPIYLHSVHRNNIKLSFYRDT